MEFLAKFVGTTVVIGAVGYVVFEAGVISGYLKGIADVSKSVEKHAKIFMRNSDF